MALTAWVEQDGELKVLGTVEEEARIFYDVSGNQLFIQTDDSGGTLVDRLTVSNAGLGTWAGAFTVSGVLTADGNITVPDDDLLGIGTGNTARLSWDTTDANANALLLQMPAGGAVDVPVLAIGQSIESVDLGLFNGLVDPTIALFGIGAVATGTLLRVYKARGTIASPTVVTSGDDLFSINAYGAVAAGEYVQAARILFEMTGTIATTRGPGVITFQTATDAAPSVLTTALTISAAQLVTMAAGATLTTGNLTFSAASDVVVIANTAAALEVSDGTTKLLVFDTRNTVTGVVGAIFLPSAPTIASAAGVVYGSVRVATYTLTLTGTTTVNALSGVGLGVLAPTITDTSAVTVSEASTLYVDAAPTAGGSVTITNKYAFYAAGGPSRIDGGLYLQTTSADAKISTATSGTGTVTHYIGNQTITTASDMRLKKNITDTVVSAMEKFRQLRVVDYQWNDPTDNGPNNRNKRGRWTGLLAQETVDILPYIINAPDRNCPICRAGGVCIQHESYWFADYDHMAGLFVKGFQEVDERLVVLEETHQMINNGWLKEQIKEALEDAEFSGWLREALAGARE